MLKQWIIAGLMGATAIVPIAAEAAEKENNTRWGARQESSRSYSSESRSDSNRQWRQDSRVQQRVAPQTTERAQRPQYKYSGNARVSDTPERRDARVDQRRDWRQDRRDNQQDWRQTRRDDRQEWRGAKIDQRRDWRDGHRDWKKDRRDDRRDWARSDWKRDNRHDWRDDRRDWRKNDRHAWDHRWRSNKRYDWQYYRSRHRHVYRAPRYYAPYGWDYGYRRFSVGVTLFSGLYGSSYWIDDPWYYRLPPAYGSLRWVRYYDDALLVDVRTGEVVDVINDFFW